MSFKLVIPYKKVMLGEQAVEFRGLSFDDITLLLQDYAEDVEKVFALLSDEKDAADIDASAMGERMLKEVPALVGKALAVAMDDTDAEAEMKKAPLGFLLMAAEVVFELTTEPAGGAKKFFERLAALMINARPSALKA